jgi:transposase
MAATQRTEHSVIEEKLYMAIEMSAKSWKLAFGVGGRAANRMREVGAGDLKKLGEEIGKAREKFGLSVDCAVYSCYEAGRDGFWLHRWLEVEGVKNLVVDSASILVNRRARKAKTDQLDAMQLLVQLYQHYRGEARVWSVVRVPDEELEQTRLLVRERDHLVKLRTRERLRISSALIRYGMRVKDVGRLTPGSVAGLRGPEGKPLDERQCQEIERALERLKLLGEQIESIQERQAELVAQETRPALISMIAQSMTIKGIGLQSAWKMTTEVFWRDFDNRRELAAACGLCGTPYNSGESVREQGINKASNGRARTVLIELAWFWLRHQPDSPESQWYMQRFGKTAKRARKVGIVALARRLLISWWRYLKTGEVHEGVQLKAPPRVKGPARGVPGHARTSESGLMPVAA